MNTTRLLPHFIVALGLALPTAVQADCQSGLPLAGLVMVEACAPGSDGCRSASEVLHEYMELPDDDPSTLTIGLQTSPWRMYDAEMRILTAKDLADQIRPSLKPEVKRVRLDGSWTGVAPNKRARSLAKQLSDALEGFPVAGMDGFMWVASDGKVRTTQQAFTIRKGAGPYGVPPGKEVMVALVAGWKAEQQDYFIEKRDAEGVLLAAAGWDIYMLCPDRALATFELAAKLGSPIAAYNAAVIRLGRDEPGDRQAAFALLSRAVELKDARAGALLEMQQKSPAK